MVESKEELLKNNSRILDNIDNLLKNGLFYGGTSPALSEALNYINNLREHIKKELENVTEIKTFPTV